MVPAKKRPSGHACVCAGIMIARKEMGALRVLSRQTRNMAGTPTRERLKMNKLPMGLTFTLHGASEHWRSCTNGVHEGLKDRVA